MQVGSEKKSLFQRQNGYLLFPLNFIQFLRKQSLYSSFGILIFVYICNGKKITQEDNHFLQHLMLGLYEFKT